MRFVSVFLAWLFLLPCCLQADDVLHEKREFHPPYAAAVGPPHFFLEHRELRRPRVGLALSGGGARCLAQAGVLLALEENAIPIDFIVGTSMGSVIGGLYAAGYSARQIIDIARQIRWGDLMVDTPPRTTLFIAQKAERDRSYLQVRFNGLQPYIPPALTAGQKLITLLTDLTMRANYRASANFDNLRIPFRAVATDLYSGRQFIIADGELAEAMRASVAVPLLLTPVPRDSMLLLDGGLVNNIPVDIVRRHNIDLVIAIDTTSKLRDRTQLNAPWEVADQVTSIMQRDHNEEQRRAADLLIALEDDKRTSMDFSNLDSLIAAGYRATLAKMSALRRTLHSPDNCTPTDGEWLAVSHLYVNGVPSQWPRSWPACGDLDSTASGTPALTVHPHDIEALLADYYRSGDYAAVRAVWAPDSTGNALYVELTPNPSLQRLVFSGNTVYPDSILRRRIRSSLGQPINHQRSREDLESIIEHYRGDGYALAAIRQVHFEAKSGELRIDIDEGYIADIAIEGCRRTKPLVIRREFPLHPGDIFDSNRSARGIQNIHSLGLFDRVALTVTRRDPQSAAGFPTAVEPTAVVHIKLQEKPSQLARIGARYDTERAGRLWLEIGDENALGIASKLLAQGVVGARDDAGLLSWRVDRLFKTYLNFSMQAHYRYAKNFTYGEDHGTLGEYEDKRYGISLSLGQQVRRFGAVAAELDLSDIRLEGLSGSGYPVGYSTVSTLTLRSVVDTQDRMPFARRGRYVHLAYTMAYKQLQSEPSFFKFFARLESSTTFRKRHTLNPRFMAGTSDQTAPFSEHYRIGGPDQIYGLRDQELIGRHFVLLSLEHRYRFPTKFLFDTYLTARFDFGAVWRDQDDINYKKFRKAFGLALAWDTPMGPIVFAVGRMERRAPRFYVTAGYRF